MEIQISEAQRRASIAALSAPSFNGYAGVPSDPNQCVPWDTPFYDEQGILRRPAWSELYSMAAAYVDYHFKGLYSVSVFSESRQSLVQVVVDEWLSNIGPIRGIGYEGEWNSTAIDDLQTGFKREALPLWKIDHEGKRPWHWKPPCDEPLDACEYYHEPLEYSNYETYGESYVSLDEQASAVERLQALLDWSEGLHPVTAEYMVQPPLENPMSEGSHIEDIVLYENNYSALRKGGRTYYPASPE